MFFSVDEPNLNSGSWEDSLPLSVTTKAAMATARHSGSVASPPGATLAPTLEQRNLSHTPSARTVSSEESWCSEGPGSERCLSSDDEDESDRSATSSVTPRNSQLRSTFNKARHHLSFDKWRSSSNATMPTPPQPESTTPGESPGGRLSRWFSIRRGSSHQYDISGKDSGDSTDNSAQQTPTQSNNSRTPSSSGKMPQLSESEEDSPFGLSNLMGSRSNGSLLSLSTRGGIVGRQLPPTLPPAPAGLSQEQLKRRLIVASICHSENSYIGTLQRLVNDYKKPLDESSPPILSTSKISTLFYRLPEILQCHTLFRIALAECVRNWDRDEKIGDVFIGAFSKPIVLDIYSGFINNFSAAMELAKMEAKRKSALADFFKVKQISAHDRLSFFGLMDLLKYTPQGHQDRMALQLALTQLESLAEMLNERKREAEQYQAFKEMLGHISGTFNTRSLSTDGNSRNRYLLREDNVTQLEFNQCGFIVKSKQRRLLLLNDKVICVSVAPKQSSDFGATEKLSFKWMFPVADVEIVDNSTSATLSRILTAGLNRGGSLKSNTSQTSAPEGSNAPNGADNLCNEMSNLMHDYEIVSRINDLVGSLKGSYSEISTDITRKILNNIQSSIQKKDEEMAWMDSCCLQLVAKSKSGKEETFTFQTENPAVKKEWITELRLAQLALDSNNSPSWEVPDHERRPLTKMPLFVKAQSIHKTQHQTEVRCGCYYSITSSRLTARRKTRVQNYLWVCTTDGSSSHIAILVQHPQQTGLLKDVSAFDLPDTVATAMEFVRGALGACEMDASSEGTVDGDSVWIATDNRKILVYAACNPEQEEQVASCPVPGNVSQILHHLDFVVASLSNGCVLIFRRRQGGAWNLTEPQVISLSPGDPVTSILPINTNIYAACGKKYPGNLSVNLMAHSGIGLWISLKHSSIICLYHTESFKHLQDLNIASNVLKLTSSQKESPSSSSSVFVTALMATKGLLWVGTNVGIALTIPLPRLEGVPIISGGVSISYHAHFGPITFLLPLIPKGSSTAPKGQHLHHNAVQGTPGRSSLASKQDNENSSARESPSGNSDHQPVVLARRKIEKQLSTESPISVIPAKLKAHLTNSPVVLRRQRFKEASESMRMSQTLPRSLGSAAFFSQSSHSNMSSLHGSEHGCCDVYGLYGGLIFVKEDFEAEEGQGNLMDPSYECLRRSDPELIPIKVSTLDRRMRMKVSRPRSLDLSNWSVDSRSSSMYTSSGSEESMGMRLQSVSRNSSNASRKITIAENSVTMDNHDHQESQQVVTSTPVAPTEATTQIHPTIATTMQRTKKNGKQAQQFPEIAGKRTIITLTGGRGYINWRHVWYNTSEKQQRSGSISSIPRVPNSNDAHIVIWEKKL
uniref:Putative guanine nucleotide exchange factor n=1 Tax=Lutzomyia longipalpis TaxID=7200 RepID=A0A7G3ATU0_LUTLO